MIKSIELGGTGRRQKTYLCVCMCVFKGNVIYKFCLKMQERFISVLSLYFYTRLENFNNLLHLVCIVEDYSDFLLNETIALVKAANIQNQYKLEKKLKLFSPSYGEQYMSMMKLAERENAIEETIENIIAIDIAILQLIASVPDHFEKNSYHLPRNVDTPFIMGEYMMAKETNVLSTVSHALKLYQQIAASSDNKYEIYKLDVIVFNNTQFLSRLADNRLLPPIGSEGQKKYKLSVDFINNFYSQARKFKTPADQLEYLSKLLNFQIDLRQILYCLSSLFATDNLTHINLKSLVTDDSYEIDEDRCCPRKKSRTSIKTQRECAIFATKFMEIIVHFMMLEDQQDKVELTAYVAKRRNDFILVLNRILEHLLEYNKFKANNRDNHEFMYSKLPLRSSNIPSPENKSISQLMYLIQYALNFAPFLAESEI